jgi:hypothetical protein
MRWNCNLIELLIFNFSFILHFWTHAQTLIETTTSLSSLVDD